MAGGGFVKIYESITRSSVWLESNETRIVWITMLVIANADGVVEASVGGLAHEARVSKDACMKALCVLEGPDDDSRSSEYEGRRIEKVDGGWVILNHGKYRARQSKAAAQSAERMRKKRLRERLGLPVGATDDQIEEALREEALRNERNSERNSEHVTAGSHQKQKQKQKQRSDPESPPDGRTTQDRDSASTSPPEAVAVAQHLYDAITSHSPELYDRHAPSALEKKLQGWTVHIDRAIRIDKRTPDELRAVIDYAHRNPRDTFWRGNMLSGKKLRDKFETIAVKLKHDRSQSRGPAFTADGKRLDEIDFNIYGTRAPTKERDYHDSR